MYTAKDARQSNQDDLDERIERAVRNSDTGTSAYMRIYIEDAFAHSIVSDLEERGFTNVYCPDFVLKTDVYFEWSED